MFKPHGSRSIPLAERFNRMFIKAGPDECWLWQGTRDMRSGGHGRIRDHEAARNVLAHRVAYELHYGIKVRPDIKVLHRCDTPACVNPTHLFLGSQQANLADMYAKGRGPVVKGNKNPRAKLTDGDVRQIRQLLADGRTQRSIALTFNVTRPLIGMIARGEIWTHLQ